MLSNLAVDLNGDRKYCSFEQISSIISDMGEYIKSEMKKFIHKILLDELFKDREDTHITVRKCREELEHNPKDPVANTHLGTAYLIKDKINMAIRQFKKSLETLPDYNEALYYLAVAYYLQDKPDSAYEYFHKIDFNPDLVRLCIMGDIYYSNGEIPDSIQFFKKAIEMDSNFSLPYIALGNICSFEGNFPRAIECYGKGLDMVQHSIISICIAFNHYLSGNIPDGMEIIKKLFDADPDYSAVNFMYAFLLSQSDNTEEAIKYCHRAIELEESNYLFYKTLGYLYLGLGSSELAMESYMKSLELNQDNLSSLSGLAFVLQSTGQFARALDEYKDIISKNPENGMVYYHMGTVERIQGNLDNAIEYYTKAISLDRNIALHHAGLGLACLDKWIKNQKNDKNLLLLSQDSINLALKLEPSLSLARLGLGIISTERDNIPEGIRHFEALLRISPDYFPAKAKLYEAFLALAEKHFAQGKPEAAIEAAEKALELNPDEDVEIEGDFSCVLKGAKDLLVNYCEKTGDQLYKKGMVSKSLEYYEKILELQPYNFIIHFKIGTIFAIKKDFSVAEKHYKEALSVKPDFDDAYFNLGLLYKNTGNNSGAIECFQSYLTISPSGIHAGECREYIKEILPEKKKIEEISVPVLDEYIPAGKSLTKKPAGKLISSEDRKKSRISTYVVHYGPLSSGEEDLRLMGDVSGKKILDLGCGEGQNSIALARQGARVTALEFSEEKLAFAAKIAREADVTVKFVCDDIEKISSLEGQKFDIVLSSFTISCIEDISRVFVNVRRVVKDGGFFVFSLEHPLMTNISKEDYLFFHGNTYPLVKNYFHTGKEERTGHCGRVVVYKRKMEDIINPLVLSGFRLVQIIEPPVYDINNMSQEEIDDIPFLPCQEECKYMLSTQMPVTLIIKSVAF
ncbi:MAG: tetratricopeptide repeat protein [Candidatus Eremiobacterota bacterium]